MDLFELLGRITVDNSNANKALGDTTDKASKSSKSITSSFKKIAGAVATYMSVNAIKDFGLGCINAASDAQAASSQFSQVFGDLESEAAKSLSGIAGEAGITETRMKGSFTKIAAFAKTTGMNTADALALSERAMVAVADSAAFYDRSLEETTESLQSFLKGNYENDAALGLSATETTRNAAANKLYGKSFKDLSEEQKQLTLLQMVEDANKLSGALGQAARESDTWTNVTGNLQQSWTDFKATLGKHVLPTMTQLVKKLAGFVQTASTKVEPAVEFLSEKFKILKDWLSDIGGYISSKFQPVFENLKTAFSNVKDMVQPLIDKFSDYTTSGEGAKDATNRLKDTIDLLAKAAELVTDGLVAITDWCAEHQGTIEVMAVVVGSFATAWGLVNGAMKLWNTVGIIATAVTNGFAAAVAFVTSPVTLTIAAIGALIAIGVLLYKNWDVISEKCSEMWGTVKEKFTDMTNSAVKKATELKDKAVEKFNSLKTDAVNKFNEMKTNVVNKFNEMKTNASNKVNELKTNAVNRFNEMKTNALEKVTSLKTDALAKFESIRSGITEKIEAAKKKVGEAIEKIKGFFDFEWSLPKPKIPKFSVSGGKAPWGFAGKGSLPKVGVEWMAKGGIMTEPTLFDYNPATGTAKVGGEAGAEAVAPIDTLQKYVRAAVQSENSGMTQRMDRIIALLVQFFPAMLEALDLSFYVDGRELAVVTAPAMDEELGKISIKKGRGR